MNQILNPLVQGCETKDLKIIKFCLGMMQRFITQQVVDQKGARYITDALWMLMENNIEEVEVLQTATLLLTTNTIAHGDILAKSLVLCFRSHYTKNPTIINTVGATIRQLLSLVFERVYLEKEANYNIKLDGTNKDASTSTDSSAEILSSITNAAADIPIGKVLTMPGPETDDEDANDDSDETESRDDDEDDINDRVIPGQPDRSGLEGLYSAPADAQINEDVNGMNAQLNQN